MSQWMMNTRKCLYCYQPLGDTRTDFHAKCSLAFFQMTQAPSIEYTNAQMLELADKVIKSHVTVTGVQPKLSLGISQLENSDKPKKLTIMGVMGSYILKPPSEEYNHLPELESLSMHLAQSMGIRTVPFSLIRLKSGELAYITRRIDRKDNAKIHMEDMCQITQRLTEHKYRGSYEQIAKAIVLHTTNPAFDLLKFYELLVFCFLTGNNDMHLKNFSLIQEENGYSLSPAYDLLASSLVVEGDDEETALTLNGKKKRLNRTDFEAIMMGSKLGKTIMDRMFRRISKQIPKWESIISDSFLSDEMKEAYLNLVTSRANRLQL